VASLPLGGFEKSRGGKFCFCVRDVPGCAVDEAKRNVMQIPIWFLVATTCIAVIMGAMAGISAAPTVHRARANRYAGSAATLYAGIVDALIQLRQQNDPAAAASRLQAALEADKERFRK
jgi:hypothetical protein